MAREHGTIVGGSCSTFPLIHQNTLIPREEKSRPIITICSRVVMITCTMKIPRESTSKQSEGASREGWRHPRAPHRCYLHQLQNEVPTLCMSNLKEHIVQRTRYQFYEVVAWEETKKEKWKNTRTTFQWGRQFVSLTEENPYIMHAYAACFGAPWTESITKCYKSGNEAANRTFQSF